MIMISDDSQDDRWCLEDFKMMILQILINLLCDVIYVVEKENQVYLILENLELRIESLDGFEVLSKE